MSKRNFSENISLNSIHCSKILEYTNNEQLAEKKKEKLSKMIVKLDKLRQKMEKPKYISTLDDDVLLTKLVTDIDDLEIEIHRINNNTSIIEYLDLTNDIITDYYSDNVIYSPGNIIVKPNRKIIKKELTKKKIIYNNSYDIRSFLDPEKKIIPKRNYLEEYTNAIDNMAITYQKQSHDLISKCENCGFEKTVFVNEGTLVCVKCGNTDFIIIEPERYSNKESNGEKHSHTYQRINHFKQRLSQFQETSNITNTEYRLIVDELKSRGYTSFKFLTFPYMQTDLMRKVLKKLKLNIYYKHCSHIMYTLSQTKTPEISQDLRSILIKMFEMIQQPFEKHKPKTRINFLSYSYVFFKFLELLNLNELKQSFSLLKSSKKLREQDEVWKKICSELNWPYYSSPMGKINSLSMKLQN